MELELVGQLSKHSCVVTQTTLQGPSEPGQMRSPERRSTVAFSTHVLGATLDDPRNISEHSALSTKWPDVALEFARPLSRHGVRQSWPRPNRAPNYMLRASRTESLPLRSHAGRSPSPTTPPPQRAATHCAALERAHAERLRGNPRSLFTAEKGRG